MLTRTVLLWVLGLLIIVPYGTYYLLFQAPREEYALLITLILFWIFGYWGVAGPILAAVRVRKVFRAIETVKSRGQLTEILRSKETRGAAIDLIALENRIPRFLAERVYRLLVKKLSSPDASRQNSDAGGQGH